MGRKKQKKSKGETDTEKNTIRAKREEDTRDGRGAKHYIERAPEGQSEIASERLDPLQQMGKGRDSVVAEWDARDASWGEML